MNWRLLRTFERVQAVGTISLSATVALTVIDVNCASAAVNGFRSLMLKEGINTRNFSNALLSRMFQIWTALGSRNFAIRSLVLGARYPKHLVLPHMYIFGSGLLQSTIISLSVTIDNGVLFSH